VQQDLARLMAMARQAEESRRFSDAIALLQQVVAAQPAHAPAWLRLSHVLQWRDDYTASRDACLRAAALVEGKPGAAAFVPHVTMRLLAFDERVRIRDLAAALDPVDPRVVPNAPALAQHLWLCGHFDEALRLVEAARAQGEPGPLLAHASATLHQFLGHREEAIRAYERAIALAPDFAGAHWGLAYHQASTVPGERIDRVERARARVSRGTLDHVQLCYAAFKEYDHADRREEAWAALAEGAAAMRRLGPPWRREVEAARVDAMIRACPPPAAMSCGEAGITPVFIVGLPRTGTTVLERMLGNHPRVVAAGELNDLQQAACTVTGRFLPWPSDAEGIAALHKAGLARMGQEYLRRIAPFARKADVVIDKNPANFDVAGLACAALPKARILCLRRAPMDAGFSNFKELFVGGGYGYSYDLRDIAARLVDFERLLAHWQALLGDRLLLVDYEEMVRKPADTAARVAAFCGLEPRSGLAEMEANPNPVTSASSSQVREPVHTRNLEAWRRYEAELAPLGAALGQRLSRK